MEIETLQIVVVFSATTKLKEIYYKVSNGFPRKTYCFEKKFKQTKFLKKVIMVIMFTFTCTKTWN